jgi:hypothetical protein
MNALYRNRLYRIHDVANDLTLEDATGRVFTVPLSDETLVIDPTDDEVALADPDDADTADSA